jgi:hypothetical protein
MSEYIKDPSAPEGWRAISYDGKTRGLTAPDTVEEDRDEAMSDGSPIWESSHTKFDRHSSGAYKTGLARRGKRNGVFILNVLALVR